MPKEWRVSVFFFASLTTMSEVTKAMDYIGLFTRSIAGLSPQIPTTYLIVNATFLPCSSIAVRKNARTELKSYLAGVIPLSPPNHYYRVTPGCTDPRKLIKYTQVISNLIFLHNDLDNKLVLDRFADKA